MKVRVGVRRVRVGMRVGMRGEGGVRMRVEDVGGSEDVGEG